MAITIRTLRAECASLEDALVNTGAASADELARIRPGSKDSPGRDDRAWLMHYGELRARHRVAVGGGAAGSGGSSRGGLTPDIATAQNLAAEPKPVRLVDGSTHYVHPKGEHALSWLDSLDRQLLDMYADAAALTTSSRTVGEPFALMPLAKSYAVQLWAWVLTHPGPEMPFEDHEHDVEAPAWTRAMAPEDVVALFIAHVEVHSERLRLSAELFPPDPARPGTPRLTLSGFTGTQAAELGVRPSDLRRKWSLGERFGMAITAAVAHQAMRERAEAERRNRGEG